MIYERLFEHIKFAGPRGFAALHQSIARLLRLHGAIVACAVHKNVNLSLYCWIESKVRCHKNKTAAPTPYSAAMIAPIDLAQTRASSLPSVAI
jgi:hypothetical protein